MDVVLEGLDTFLFDHLYAALLPAETPGFTPNGTFSSLRELPTDTPYTAAQWEYKPATQYLTFRPRPVAYQSQWVRDDYRRQLLSLFLITWFGPPSAQADDKPG
jgi:lathosterol oxidase